MRRWNGTNVSVCAYFAYNATCVRRRLRHRHCQPDPVVSFVRSQLVAIEEQFENNDRPLFRKAVQATVSGLRRRRPQTDIRRSTYPSRYRYRYMRAAVAAGGRVWRCAALQLSAPQALFCLAATAAAGPAHQTRSVRPSNMHVGAQPSPLYVFVAQWGGGRRKAGNRSTACRTLLP